MNIKAIILLFGAFLLISCSSPTQESKTVYLQDFRQFILIVENRQSINNIQWIEFDNQFNIFSETEFIKYEHIFTETEFAQIADFRRRYKARKLRSKAINGIKETIDETKTFLEELIY